MKVIRSFDLMPALDFKMLALSLRRIPIVQLLITQLSLKPLMGRRFGSFANAFSLPLPLTLFIFSISIGCVQRSGPVTTEAHRWNGSPAILLFHPEVLAGLVGAGIDLAFNITEKMDQLAGNRGNGYLVTGRCQNIKDRSSDLESCQNTYLIFNNLKTQKHTRVWVDEKGQFQFPFNKGEKYVVAAFNEKEKTHSKAITFNEPGHLTISLNL